MPINIGDSVIDRPTAWTYVNWTAIVKANPADASGIITVVEIWAVAGNPLVGCRVGTFYTTNGDTLKCRDSVVIGDVPAGSKQTFSGLSLAVEAGDYIGIFFTGGEVEREDTGQAGMWYVTSEQIDPGDEAVYTPVANYTISLGGTGEVSGTNIGNKSANMGAKMMAGKLI